MNLDTKREGERPPGQPVDANVALLVNVTNCDRPVSAQEILDDLIRECKWGTLEDCSKIILQTTAELSSKNDFTKSEGPCML